jgi:hypothetical protein
MSPHKTTPPLPRRGPPCGRNQDDGAAPRTLSGTLPGFVRIGQNPLPDCLSRARTVGQSVVLAGGRLLRDLVERRATPRMTPGRRAPRCSTERTVAAAGRVAASCAAGADSRPGSPRHQIQAWMSRTITARRPTRGRTARRARGRRRRRSRFVSGAPLPRPGSSASAWSMCRTERSRLAGLMSLSATACRVRGRAGRARPAGGTQ